MRDAVVTTLRVQLDATVVGFDLVVVEAVQYLLWPGPSSRLPRSSIVSDALVMFLDI